MQLTLTIDTATASADDFRRAASTLLHFGLGPNQASLTIDRTTIAGPAASISDAATAAAVALTTAATTPDPATIGFGSDPSPTPDPATIGFGTAPVDPAAAGDSTEELLARVERDADGLPHDSRIHAGTRTKNKDGRWKKKKAVSETEVARIEAELRTILNLPPPAPPAAATPPAPPAPSAAPPPPPAPDAAPAPPAPAAAPAPPAPAAASSVSTFPQLMGWVGPALVAGHLSATKVEETLRSLGIVDGAGVGQLALLAMRPDLVPGAYAALTEAAGA